MQDPTTQKPEPISLTHNHQTQTSSETSSKPKSMGKRLFIILLAITLSLGGAIAYLFPKAQSVRFASTTRQSVSNLFTEMDTVDSSLNALFKFSTTGEESDVQLSSLTKSFQKFNIILSSEVIQKEEIEDGNEFGLRLDDLIDDLSEVFKNLEISDRGSVNFGDKVKGFTTPADDPNKIYRDQRDLAVNVGKSVKSSEKSINELSRNISAKAVPNSLSFLKGNINQLKSESQDYLSEAQRTSNYYILSSDLSIELESNFDAFALSLQGSSDINSLVSSFDEISNDLRSLKSKLEKVSPTNLPNEIEDYHRDSIALFDVVINYFNDLKVLTLKGDDKKIINLTIDTSLALNKLVLSGVDHEISFWKNNQTLNSYDNISSSHTEVLKKLETEKDNSNFFLFKFFGVE